MTPKILQPRPWWQAPPLILFLTTLVLYAVTAGFDFQVGWDDYHYILGNNVVTSASIKNIREAFTGYFVGNYAPVHILSYMLDYALWGANPAGYHLENVILHAFNGVLFYYFLRRSSLGEVESAAAAWIFLTHPVQVETVAWIAQRKNLLAMAFFLIAFLSYENYRRTGKHIPYLMAVGSMATAVLSKSIAVIFPLTVLLYDLTMPQHRARTRQTRVLDLLPLVLVATAAALMAITSQSLDNGGGRRQYHGGSPVATFFTMVPVLLSYIKDCIWPFGLSPSYETPIRIAPDLTFAAAFATLVLAVYGGIRLYRKNREVFFWYGLFFICLIPVLQIIPLVTLKNDRYLYFPLLGFAVIAVKVAGVIMRYPGICESSWRKYPVYLSLLLLPILSFRQCLIWKDDISLWKHAVAVDQRDRKAWSMLILSYIQRGDMENATAVSRQAQAEYYRWYVNRP